MLHYEVFLDVEPNLAGLVEEHMIREHIPEIFATGCFQRIRFEQASPLRFRTSYEAGDEAELQRYFRDYAPRLRAKFQASFPSGIVLTRETWKQLQCWG